MSYGVIQVLRNNVIVDHFSKPKEFINKDYCEVGSLVKRAIFFFMFSNPPQKKCVWFFFFCFLFGFGRKVRSWFSFFSTTKIIFTKTKQEQKKVLIRKRNGFVCYLLQPKKQHNILNVMSELFFVSLSFFSRHPQQKQQIFLSLHKK